MKKNFKKFIFVKDGDYFYWKQKVYQKITEFDDYYCENITYIKEFNGSKSIEMPREYELVEIL